MSWGLSSVNGFAGDVLVVDFGTGGLAGDLYLLTDLKQPINSLLVQQREMIADSIVWITKAEISPRKNWGEDVVPKDLFHFSPGDTARIRLLWTDEHKLDQIALIPPVTTALRTRVLRATEAVHSDAGHVEFPLLREDGVGVSLRTDQSIELGFEAPALHPNFRRDFVLLTAGAWWAVEDSTAHRSAPRDMFAGILGARVQGVSVDSPVITQVQRARPNPVAGAMTLDFSLAERGVVTARVTDVRGRVVRTLSERWWDRGAHTLTWDGRSDAGSTAAAGVYFLVVKLNGQRLSTQKLQVLR
jgi:hypothetical protein